MEMGNAEPCIGSAATKMSWQGSWFLPKWMRVVQLFDVCVGFCTLSKRSAKCAVEMANILIVPASYGCVSKWY